MCKNRFSVEIDECLAYKVKERCKEIGMSMEDFVESALVLVILGKTSTDFGYDYD